MSVNAEVGGDQANSYVTLSEFNAYMATRTPNSKWDVADTEANTNALLSGMRRLEQEQYKGRPRLPPVGTSNTPAQALSFPRYGVVSRDGWTYLDTVIPVGMKRAQMEAAYAILSGELALAQTGLEQFDRAKVGPLEVDIRHTNKGGTLPENVRRELRDFVVTGNVTVPLFRG